MTTAGHTANRSFWGWLSQSWVEIEDSRSMSPDRAYRAATQSELGTYPPLQFNHCLSLQLQLLLLQLRVPLHNGRSDA